MAFDEKAAYGFAIGMLVGTVFLAGVAVAIIAMDAAPKDTVVRCRKNCSRCKAPENS